MVEWLVDLEKDRAWLTVDLDWRKIHGGWFNCRLGIMKKKIMVWLTVD